MEAKVGPVAFGADKSVPSSFRATRDHGSYLQLELSLRFSMI